ncbi:hypothetical protein QEN19_000402 [Hanseniaspora menglaensis]
MILSQSTIPEVTDEYLSQALFERQKSLRLWSNHLQENPIEVKSPKDGEYLGPPDLVQIYKYILDPSDTTATKLDSHEHVSISPVDYLMKIKKKNDISTHFYTIGIDNSDPNSIVSYLKLVKDAIENDSIEENDKSKGQLWFGEQKKFKVGWIEYVTYDPFKYVDVHVKMYFSGKITTYYTDGSCEFVDDLKFGKFDFSSDSKYFTVKEVFWNDCFMGGIIRLLAHLNSNQFGNEANSIVECKVYNPLMFNEINNIGEMFILNFKRIFNYGHLTGSPSEFMNTTVLNNYLILSFVKIVTLTENYDLAFKIVDNMIADCNKKALKNKLNFLKIKILYAQGKILDALELITLDLKYLNTLSETELEFSMDYYTELIQLQIKVMLNLYEESGLSDNTKLDKSDLKQLTKLAEYLTKIQPHEAIPWILLTKCLIIDDQIEKALLTLNNAPLESLKDNFILLRSGFKSVLVNQEVHLPLPTDVIIEQITGLSSEDVLGEKEQVDPILRDLPGNNLKSCYSLCYELLVQMVEKVTWDTLLDIRSDIFIMDEEYAAITGKLSDENLSVKQKRICSRWLDSMFMIIYKDLKYFNKWQLQLMKLTNSEVLDHDLNLSNQNDIFKGSCFEYELLGSLSLRLNKMAESKFAYQQALSLRFSGISTKNLVPLLFNERKTLVNNSFANKLSSETATNMINDVDSQILKHLVDLTVWRHRWYMDFSVFVLESFKNLIYVYGGQEKWDLIHNEIKEQYSPEIAAFIKEMFIGYE